MTKMRVLLLSLTAVAAIGVAAAPANAATLFLWKVGGEFLEENIQKRMVSIKQTENFTLESKFGLKNIDFTCTLPFSAAEITGGRPGKATASFEFTKCKVIEPAVCTTVKAEKVKLTGEIVEILTNGRKGHKGLLMKVGIEPKITLEPCAISQRLNGKLVIDLGMGGVEAEKLTWLFPEIEEVENSAKEKIRPELGFGAEKATLLGAAEAGLEKEEKWGAY